MLSGRTGRTMLGMFAISKAGHDKGRMYLIVKEEEDFFYLADGRSRGIENPKKKRKKHIQLIKSGINELLTEKLESNQTIYNEEIKYAIKTNADALREPAYCNKNE